MDDKTPQQLVIQESPLQLGDIVHFHVVQRLGHTESDTPGFTIAQVAFLNHVPVRIEVDISKGTGHHAHLAAYTPGLVHHHGVGLGISFQGATRTDFHTGCRLTMGTGQRRNESLAWIDIHPNVRIFPTESPSPVQRAGLFTVAAANTAIEVD